MNRVEFHYNVGDKIAYSCRLLRKIIASDLRVVVVGEPGTLQALDAALWAVGATDFIPHCMDSAPPSTLAASPIWLAASWPQGQTHQVMLNLGADVPAHFEAPERYLEVVSTDESDVKAGRQRWRHYQDRGLEIQRFDRKGQS